MAENSGSHRFERLGLIIAVSSLIIVSGLFLELYVPTATSSTPTVNLGTSIQNLTSPAGANGTSFGTTSTTASQDYNKNGSVPIYVLNASPSYTTSFTPTSITLVIGVNNTVAFVNSGDVPVAIISESWPTNASGFKGPPLASNEAYVLTLNTPGIYTYTDYLHGAATGTIIVAAQVQ